MKQDIRLQTVWPATIGAMIGVEIMLSAFFLFGPAKVCARNIAALTERGAYYSNPEHDLPLYVAGCALTSCLLIALSLIQRRRLSGTQTTPAEYPIQYLGVDSRGVALRDTRADQLERSVQRHWSQVLLCLILFSIHLLILLAVRRLFMFSDGHLPVSASPYLFAVPVLSMCLVMFGWYMPWFKCPRWVGSGPAAALPFSHAVLRRQLDLVVSLLIVAVVYVPRCFDLAGRLYLQDGLHHWDFYAMGPTLAFHHGKALGTEFYTQYGVGWPLLYHAIARLIPISYGHMLHLSVIYGCTYFIGVYILLVLILKNRIWAVSGLVVAVTLQLFYGVGTDDILWRCPSSTILRSPLDIWFFICVLLHARSSQAVWLRLAAVLAGGAMLFGTDTGLYLCAAFMAYLLYLQSLPRTDGHSLRRTISLTLQCAAIALLVFLPMLWIAGRGTLLQKAFWTGWLESLMVYGGGFGALPIALVPRSTLLLFAMVLLLYLGTIGVTLVKLLPRTNTPENVILACLSTYGLATLLLFVGRSHPWNIFHVSVPFSIVAVVTLVRWCRAVEHSQGPPQMCAANTVKEPLEHVFPWKKVLPWGALVAATMMMLTNKQFQEYPGILKALFSPAPPVGVCLLKESGDVCGLPAEEQGYAATFDSVVGRLKEAVASGRTVAVFDQADPMFYLAADVAPWYRYSPLLPGLITRAQVAKLVQQVTERGPDLVVIRDNSEHLRVRNDLDAWRAVHSTVEKHYRLDSTVGVFEFWHREKP